MLKVTVCIGSSCHLKGSRQIATQIKKLIESGGLNDKIELAGAFCMGKCNSDGVSVTVGENYYSVKPESVKEFFDKYVAPKAV